MFHERSCHVRSACISWNNIVHLRRVGTRYRVGAIAVMAAGVRVAVVHARSESRIACGHFVQGRYGTQLVVRRLVVVGLLRPRLGRLLVHALHRHLGRVGRTHAVYRAVGMRLCRVGYTAAGVVVAAQRQSPHTPVEVVRTFALEKTRIVYKYQYTIRLYD